MPQLLEHIDAIARKKGRDVLLVDFGPRVNFFREHNWKDDPNRIDLIAWLEAQAINWYPCAGIASEGGVSNYQGEIYLDVPFDKDNQVYRAISGRLENPDETCKIPGVTLYYLPLEMAMRNAHHDEPGFWANWAEKF